MAGQLAASQDLLDYVRRVSLRDDDLLRGLRAETAGLPALAAMVTMPEEAQLLALLVRLTGAVNALEIGTFTGYGTLCVARALPPGGTVVTCDITDRWVRVGRPYWTRAGVADRIDVRVGPALDTLTTLRAERGPESFDFVFIDADKANYVGYYERALALLRPGGLIVVDNTLYFGRVVDPAAQDPDSRAIRRLNAALHTDERVDVSMLAIADGVTLVRKKGTS